MRRLAIKATVAAITFAVGVALVALYLWQRTPDAEIPPVALVDMTPRPTCFPGLSVPSDSPRGPSAYFPAGVLDSNPFQDQFRSDWYSEQLRALGEPSLLDAAGYGESYRFLWLRSFHHPIAIRVRTERGEIFISVREADGAGGYKPGTLTVDEERPISSEEWEDFLRLLDHACNWNVPSREGVVGNDGAEWILEGFKDGRYHLAQQWSPQDGAYREACLYLLKLSGLKVAGGEVY